ncbi:unnamed protein product [Penicillium salamii]|uniref:Uncharacterized protein n=1 Tax=Penicillium salamii TaxID=1612424 RepID=A0A9W4NTW0_9EURO|nr:unnamed protein product [Penicillium salamii]
MAEQSLPAVAVPGMAPRRRLKYQWNRSTQPHPISQRRLSTLKLLETEASYIAAIKAGLDDAHPTRRFSDMEYRKEIAPYAARVRSAQLTLRVLKRQRHVLEEDLSETVAVEKHSSGDTEYRDGRLLLERAYSDMVLTRVMKGERDRRSGRFEQSTFKKEVERYYSTVHECREKVWCHVLGDVHFQRVRQSCTYHSKKVGPGITCSFIR